MRIGEPVQFSVFDKGNKLEDFKFLLAAKDHKSILLSGSYFILNLFCF